MSTLALLLAAIGLALIVVPWGLYPAIVMMAARARGVRSGAASGAPRPDATWPTVTCVLATRDDPATIAERVANFLGQDYPADRLDVVVALDAAAAAALRAQLADLGPRVRLVDGDDPGGKCPALNAAVRAAEGELLLFSDARPS
jgi:cellulose synthase/poly-beta-1,6-N-acetylglucosamine synthase-like glycosyltransferase